MNEVYKFIENLNIGSEYIIKADIEVSGSTVVDLKTFNEIIRKIESESITFEIENSIFVL